MCSKIGDNDDTGDADVSIAVNANVEGVRRDDDDDGFNYYAEIKF